MWARHDERGHLVRLVTSGTACHHGAVVPPRPCMGLAADTQVGGEAALKADARQASGPSVVVGHACPVSRPTTAGVAGVRENPSCRPESDSRGTRGGIETP